MPPKPPNPPDADQTPSAHVEMVIAKLWQWQVGDFSPRESWSPQINLYRVGRRLELCVDLAGVDRRDIEVRVEPGRLIIRGVRHPPEPPRGEEEVMRIMSMEIDHGSFCRTIPLPEQIDLSKVASEYHGGMLWVRLPLRAPG